MDRGRSDRRSDRRTSRERAPASVGTGSQRRGQGRPTPSGDGCYRPSSHGPGPTEESRRVPPLVGWLGSLLAGRRSNAVDCVQCAATAVGRRGGDFALRAKDAGGQMASFDPS